MADNALTADWYQSSACDRGLSWLQSKADGLFCGGVVAVVNVIDRPFADAVTY